MSCFPTMEGIDPMMHMIHPVRYVAAPTLS